MPRGVKKTRRPGREAGGRSGPKEDPQFVEFDQRMKTLQLPAACSFVFGIIERYVRSLSSHEPLGTSLPSKESLLILIDTHILKIPSTNKLEKPSPVQWPFNVFEELELLDLLRTQIEDRQSLEVRLALIDSLFGLAGRDNQYHVEHCMKVLEKLVSLCVSMGCTIVLQCVACWMELYPIQSVDLSRFIYFEFCELVPNAVDPLINLCTVCPALARLFTYHLTLKYHIYNANDKALNNLHSLFPPLPLLTIVSHWISTTPEFIFIQTMLVETRDNCFLLRSQKPRSLTPSPLKGLVQWCILEPLLLDSCLSCVSSPDFRGVELASKLRIEISKLHADILTCLLSFSNSPNLVNLLSIDDLISLLGSMLSLIHSVDRREEIVEKSVDRFAQVLQAGLSVGAVHSNIDGLSSFVSRLPHNRLLKLVLTQQRKAPRTRDHIC